MKTQNEHTKIGQREKRSSKHLICLLLTTALLCGLCACGGRGASPGVPDVPDGSGAATPEPPPASKAVCHAAAESFAGGSGTEADPYRISTPEELVLFGQVNREFSDEYNEAYYVLTADIALNDVSNYANWGTEEPTYRWEPIDGCFHGVFDGGGHTISGLYVYDTTQQYADGGSGLFGHVSRATVKNLKLTQAYLTADGTDSNGMDLGCLAGSVFDCRIENCEADGVLQVANNIYVRAGGLFGNVDGGSTVRDCRFTGDIYAQSCSGRLGGIAGATGASDLVNCSTEGSIQVQSCDMYVGGIVGGSIAVDDCVNRMDLSGESSCLGGVIGTVSLNYDETAMIRNCANYGSVTGGEGSTNVGGVIGSIFNMDPRGESLQLSSLTNSGAVSGGQAVGGIIGKMSSGYLLYTIQDCENRGDVSADSEAGGVIGLMGSCVDGCRITGCSNSGTVTATSPSGGIIGAYRGMSVLSGIEGQLTIHRCVNSGTVENLGGISGTGGILGQIFMDSEEEAILFEDCENTGTVRSAGSAWMGGIVGGTGTVMPGGSWTVRNCQNSGTLSIGSGIRDFARDASLETAYFDSAAVDPSTLDEADYRQSLQDRAALSLGGSCIGGIAGKLWAGTIESCTSTGTILLDDKDSCFVGGICGQYYNIGDDANSSSIRSCRYRADWPFAVMPAVGTLENLPEGAVVNVTASIQ